MSAKRKPDRDIQAALRDLRRAIEDRGDLLWALVHQDGPDKRGRRRK